MNKREWCEGAGGEAVHCFCMDCGMAMNQTNLNMFYDLLIALTGLLLSLYVPVLIFQEQFPNLSMNAVHIAELMNRWVCPPDSVNVKPMNVRPWCSLLMSSVLISSSYCYLAAVFVQ